MRGIKDRFLISFLRLTTDRNRLFIGQYLQIEDTVGIPPTVEITSPQAGQTTLLKAFFKETYDIPAPVVVSPDGLSLVPYRGAASNGGRRTEHADVEYLARTERRRGALAV